MREPVFVFPDHSDHLFWPSTMFLGQAFMSALPEGSVFPESVFSYGTSSQMVFYDSFCEIPARGKAQAVFFTQCAGEFINYAPGYHSLALRQDAWLKSNVMKIAASTHVAKEILERHEIKVDAVLVTPWHERKVSIVPSGPVAVAANDYMDGMDQVRDLEKAGVDLKVVSSTPEACELDGCSAFLCLSLCGGWFPGLQAALYSGMPVASTMVAQVRDDFCFSDKRIACDAPLGLTFPVRDRMNISVVEEAVSRAREKRNLDKVKCGVLGAGEWAARLLSIAKA